VSVFSFSDLAFMGAVTVAGGYDPDAQAYITAVETADGQALETGVRDAINAFVVGCKADGIWTAIKASCIMAGARTLNGALVPLVGAAPTRFGTEGGWNYDRKTGLKGNGTNNYLDSNRANNADPNNNNHNSCLATSAVSDGRLMGSWPGTGANLISGSTGSIAFRSRTNAASVNLGAYSASGIVGMTRSNSTQVTSRRNNISTTSGQSSQSVNSNRILIFGVDGVFWSGSAAFYSIGESLDLALLDARVTALINAFAAAIP
jgi:hypothetical protein